VRVPGLTDRTVTIQQKLDIFNEPLYKERYSSVKYMESAMAPRYVEVVSMAIGRHQRGKQRCQDLCWKVNDRAQFFVLRSYTMHEIRNQKVSANEYMKDHIFELRRII